MLVVPPDRGRRDRGRQARDHRLCGDRRGGQARRLGGAAAGHRAHAPAARAHGGDRPPDRRRRQVRRQRARRTPARAGARSSAAGSAASCTCTPARWRSPIPLTGARLHLTAPLPEHMARTWELFGWRPSDAPDDPVRGPAMTAPRLVVFDIDGTLIDSQHVILAAMAAAFAGAGHRAAGARGGARRRRPVAARGDGGAGAASAGRGDAGAGRPTARASSAQRDAAALGEAPLYPGARAALERLAAQPGDADGGRDRQGAAAGSTMCFAAHDLGAFLRHRADRGRASLQAASRRCCWRRSPRPACGPARAVMVGDTEFDIAMGRAAGFATVGVTWGYHPRARLRGGRRRPGDRRLRRARRGARRRSGTAGDELDAASAVLAAGAGAAGPGGFAVALDDRPLRRRARRRCWCRPRRWPRRSPPNGTRSRPRSEPERLPFTRAANSAIDRVALDPGPRGGGDRRLRRGATCSATAPRRRRACRAAGRRLGPLARLGGARPRGAAGDGDAGSCIGRSRRRASRRWRRRWRRTTPSG